jgi:8-oxo-dGTP diphosphatase
MAPAAAFSSSAVEHPLVSARVIAFAVDRDGLNVVLLRRGDRLALPRSELRPGETLANCAERIALDAFAAQPDYLEQLYTFSSVSPRAEVSVAYFALLSADTRATVQRKPSVAFRHVDGELSPDSAADATDATERAMLRYATTRLRAKLGYSNIAFYFLPREFSLSELQDVYEMALGRQLDKRNFRRRILAAGIVEAVGAKRSGVNHRPAALYRFAGGDPATGALTPVETEWSS